MLRRILASSLVMLLGSGLVAGVLIAGHRLGWCPNWADEVPRQERSADESEREIVGPVDSAGQPVTPPLEGEPVSKRDQEPQPAEKGQRLVSAVELAEAEEQEEQDDKKEDRKKSLRSALAKLRG